MASAQHVLDHLVRLAEHEQFGAHGIQVRVGDDTARFLWDEDVRRDVHSVAKGICVLAAGIAVDDGVFDLDAPVAQYFSDLVIAPETRDVTVRNLLGMVSGVDFPWSPTLLTDWPDLAAEFLSRPSRGRVFQYSNASTYTAMRALGSVVGDVGSWLEDRLFTPLGIATPTWQRCPNGFIEAGGGLELTLDELAVVGQLIRDGGRYNGEQLVSPELVRTLHTDWSEHDAEPSYRRYALGGWDGPGSAWRLHGAYGQLLIFHGDAVVTITAHDHEGADPFAEQVVALLERR
ncbi:serine hydrolase domain-containing protein [Microbacterium sp. ZW T5_56]|uniref:serine hydrolase domain-containing protein n=1 Tax=Microbacterium sp. ZW T5_56 TaxID=3378081 RepID=UPI003853D05E